MKILKEKEEYLISSNTFASNLRCFSEFQAKFVILRKNLMNEQNIKIS